MVVSRYNESFPGPGMADRVIPGGPLYPRGEVLSLLAERGAGAVIQWTKKCIRDIQRQELGAVGVFHLLKEAVGCGRFIGAEWCESEPSGPWAACDAYELNRRKWSDVAHKEIEDNYYVKIAIGMSGKILLLVSCHPPK